MLSIRRLCSSTTHFEDELNQFIIESNPNDETISDTVTEIIKNIRCRGDVALLEYVAQYDNIKAEQVTELRIETDQIAAYAESVDCNQANALQKAMHHITEYANQQKLTDHRLTVEGTEIGQRVTAIESAGLYIPGGKASYPSSVLMGAIPAKVAGVKRIVAVTPAPNKVLNPLVAYALQMVGLEEVYAMGGAQAIAALAYGTETISRVKKIVGPGNAYVAEAKRQVYGEVGIDMPAGPSEILIICDAQTDPTWIACDLCAQAEHDEMARSILICHQSDYLDEVMVEINRFIKNTPRKAIIQKSLANNGLFIETETLDQAVAIANHIAPEHLELSVEQPDALLDKVSNAGAIFMGRYSSEVVGDYCAGPNHVLPTAGGAGFLSPLGVYDFQKRSSIIQCSQDSAATLGEIAACLAEAEGLFAHAESARCRIPKLK